jgi:hypothetical protein
VIVDAEFQHHQSDSADEQRQSRQDAHHPQQCLPVGSSKKPGDWISVRSGEQVSPR